MLSWDMDHDMAVYDEGNTDHRKGNNSALLQFYSLAIAIVGIALEFKTTALSCRPKKYRDHKVDVKYCFVVNKKWSAMKATVSNCVL